MRTGLTALVILVTASWVSAQDQFDVKQMHGTWEIEKLPPKSKATIEFTKENKMIMQFNTPNRNEKREGTYQLEGETLIFKFTFNGKQETRKVKMLKLSGKEMTLKDLDREEEQVLKKVP